MIPQKSLFEQQRTDFSCFYIYIFSENFIKRENMKNYTLTERLMFHDLLSYNFHFIETLSNAGLSISDKFGNKCSEINVV